MISRTVVFAVNFLRETSDKIKNNARNYFLGFKIFLNVKNWKDYYFDCKKKAEKKFIVYDLKNGLKIITRSKTKDRDIFSEIFFGNEYFFNEFKLPEKAVVFDVGAHIGVFSVFVSNKAQKIFAFEPAPENFELLKKNIELNRLESKVFAFNSAVSSRKGTQKFFLYSFNSGGNSFFQLQGTGMKKSIEVLTITLKEVFEKHKIKECDLMKVDIEGEEFDLFYNMPEKTLKKIKRIVMECHPFNENKPEKLVEFLKQKGFKIKKQRKSFGMLLILAENKK